MQENTRKIHVPAHCEEVLSLLRLKMVLTYFLKYRHHMYTAQVAEKINVFPWMQSACKSFSLFKMLSFR